MPNPDEIRAQVERYSTHCGEYSNDFERNKLLRDWTQKEKVAETLVEDFRRRTGELHGRRLLELGFGSGLHIPAFVRAGAEVYGLEVNAVLLDLGRKNMAERHIDASLKLYDGLHMPYPDNYFDYIFATSVLEHVSDIAQVVKEMDRVLKPHGRCYISFPNRYAPRETHTGFLFVQYLPRPLAAAVLRALGSNAVADLNLNFLSFFKLRKALRSTSLYILPETESSNMLRASIKKLCSFFGMHPSVLLKTIMLVLEKDGKNPDNPRG